MKTEQKEEETFKIGDKVVCPVSGRKAEIIKYEKVSPSWHSDSYHEYFTILTKMPARDREYFLDVTVKCLPDNLRRWE